MFFSNNKAVASFQRVLLSVTLLRSLTCLQWHTLNKFSVCHIFFPLVYPFCITSHILQAGMCSIYLKVCKHHQSSFSANIASWGQFSYITLLNLECGAAFCHRPSNTFSPATVLGIFYVILCCTHDPTVLSATDLGRSWNMSVFISVINQLDAQNFVLQ